MSEAPPKHLETVLECQNLTSSMHHTEAHTVPRQS